MEGFIPCILAFAANCGCKLQGTNPWTILPIPHLTVSLFPFLEFGKEPSLGTVFLLTLLLWPSPSAESSISRGACITFIVFPVCFFGSQMPAGAPPPKIKLSDYGNALGLSAPGPKHETEVSPLSTFPGDCWAEQTHATSILALVLFGHCFLIHMRLEM